MLLKKKNPTWIPEANKNPRRKPQNTTVWQVFRRIISAEEGQILEREDYY